MITLEESKERLLLEIQKAAYHYKQKKGNDSIESYRYLEAYKKLMECYDHTSQLPVSDIVFTWYRLNIADIRVDYDDNGVRIYKAGGVYYKRNICKISGADPIDGLIDQALYNEN
jgi:hypothetical protein